MFIKITLGGNIENKFSLPGKQIIKLILEILKIERENQFEDIIEIINNEFNKAEYSSEMAQWQGIPIEEELYNRVKKDILFEIKERLKKYEKGKFL